MDAVSKATAQAAATEIQKAIAPILEKYNLQLSKQRLSYGDIFKFVVEASAVEINEDGINMASPDVVAYQRNGYIGQVVHPNGKLDFPTLTAPIGTRYSKGAKVYAFAGVRARGKMKIILNCLSDGKTYVFPDEIISTLNESAAKAATALTSK